MSDMPADYRERLDLRAQIARIDEMQASATRQREETQKFVAEQHKLIAEQTKLAAERIKYDAEARKLDRDRNLSPWLAIAGLIGGVLAIANFVAQLIHH
jgi:hypothetical protein